MENSAPSLKIFRTSFKLQPSIIVEIKIGGKTRFEKFTKTIIPFALVGYEVITTNSHYALVVYFITSYPTRAHGIIVIYLIIWARLFKTPISANPRLNMLIRD